jgi:hypothetical protein
MGIELCIQLSRDVRVSSKEKMNPSSGGGSVVFNQTIVPSIKRGSGKINRIQNAGDVNRFAKTLCQRGVSNQNRGCVSIVECELP